MLSITGEALLFTQWFGPAFCNTLFQHLFLEILLFITASCGKVLFTGGSVCGGGTWGSVYGGGMHGRWGA